MSVIKLKSGDELGWIVEQYDKTLIQFSADWCGPCRRVSPVLEDKYKNLNDPTVGYIYIDIDEHKDISKAFQVTSVPHFIIYNKEKDTITLPYTSSNIDGIISYCSEADIQFK